MSLPEIVSREEWETARKELLAREKELTRARDELAADRRRLPMVLVDKDYRFEGPDGEVGLIDLFEGRHQLIVCHFMFDPEWEDGCPSCTAGADEMADGQARAPARPRHDPGLRVPRPLREDRRLQGAARLDVPVVLVARLGLQLRLPRHARRVRDAREYNFRTPKEFAAAGHEFELAGEFPGASFLSDGDRVYHTYSVYARGLETIGGSYYLLEETALGRQEDWEQPAGRAASLRGAVPDFAA